MIEYGKKFLSFNLIFRIRGSALYRAMVPALASVSIYYIFKFYMPSELNPDLQHPYGVGILMTGISFLIVFRANYGYQRYWESCGAIYNMMSKWLDATVHTAAFHMQCSHYDEIKPPSFYDYPELLKMNLCVDRLGNRNQHSRCRSIYSEKRHSRFSSLFNRASHEEELHEEKDHEISLSGFKEDATRSKQDISETKESNSYSDSDPKTIMNLKGRLDGGWGLLSDDRNEQTYDINTLHHSCFWNVGVTPSLFLQELVHLSSLCLAVSFCTLRQDHDGAVSPLTAYVPDSPWPEVDPDKTGKRENQLWSVLILRNIRQIMGFDRTTPEVRTQYNAAHPMSVLGGVSINEIMRLQHARGSSAKTQLAWYWLSEFVTRESLAGSTGKVAPPIISRIHQFLSDGMTFYNHARKIMFTPFPFPHAQISALSIFVIMVYVPFLMDQYTGETWVGVSLTFFTVLCLSGLHEVARELENPFQNFPNDIPLRTLLAMYNEALISACSGYHPDHYWLASLEQNNLLSEKRPQAEDNGYNSPKKMSKEKQLLSSIQKEQYETKIHELEILIKSQSKQLRSQSEQLEGLRTMIRL